MTLIDDRDVRTLVERADDLVPPMALDADDVLRTARRRRRRVGVLRGSTATLAVAGLAVATLQLDGGGPTATAAAVPLDSTLTAQVADDVVPVTEDDVAGVDTGVLVPGTSPTDLRYVVTARDELQVEVRVAAEDLLGTPVTAVPTRPWSTAELPSFLEVGDRHAVALGLVPPAVEGASVELVVGDDRYPLPTFEVPGAPGTAWFVRLDDPARPVASWPSTQVVTHLADGGTSVVDVTDLDRAAVRLHAERGVDDGSSVTVEVVDDAAAAD